MGDPFRLEPLPPPVIECRGVSKWFGDFCAVDDVDLTVLRGDVLAIMGPSGAGKSTLLRCINGLEAHTSGSLRVLVVELSQDRRVLELVRQHVGMVFQHFNLFPQMTVRNNVVVAQRLVLKRGDDESEARAHEALEAVDMLDHADKHPHELSGGEQQRVAIARTLALDPEIILLDEPTASVDPELTKGIVELMNDMAAAGVTVLAVTHEIGFARNTANRLLYIDEGKIIEEGHPDDLLWDAHDPRTQRFVEAITKDRVTVDEVATHGSVWAPPD